MKFSSAKLRGQKIMGGLVPSSYIVSELYCKLIVSQLFSVELLHEITLCIPA